MGSVAIVGAGISGLSAAWYLSRAGAAASLVERQPRLGGVISTEQIDGCVVEGGPDSFLAAKPWAMDLIRELGIEDEVIGSNDHQRVTYILKRGRLVPLPDGLMMMVPTRVMPVVRSRLLTWPAKVRMGLEWFRRARPEAADRSVAEFISEHYGREVVDYLAEPLLAGVYGGDPDRLSAASVLPRFVEFERTYGSLTRGVLVEGGRTAGRLGGGSLFRTLRGGMGRLIETLADRLRPSLPIRQADAEALERRGAGFRLRLAGDWMEASSVVLACPAYEAARLLRPLDADLATTLESIPYNSSMTVALGYDRATLGHPLNGFGFLVPRRERRRLVACTWVNTKFAHRAPDSRALLRCFLRGDEAQGESDESVVAGVIDELRIIMGVTALPVFTRVSRWPRSMAQYNVGHERRVEEIERRVGAIAGLHLAGNALHGIGIPDCVRSGQQAAERITASPLRVL